MIDLRIQPLPFSRPFIAPIGKKPPPPHLEPTLVPASSQDQSQVTGKLFVPEDFAIESTPVARIPAKAQNPPMRVASSTPIELDQSAELPSAGAPKNSELRKEGATLVADFARSAAALFSREEELSQLMEGNELSLKLKWLSDPKHFEQGETKPQELLELMRRLEQFKQERHRSRSQFKQDLPAKLAELTARLGIPYEGIFVEKPTDLQKEAAAQVADFANQCRQLFEREEELNQLVPPHNPNKSLSLKLKWLSDPKNLEQGRMSPRTLLETLRALEELKVEKNRSREAFKKSLEGKLSPLTERLGIPFDGITVEVPDGKSIQKEAAAAIAEFSNHCRTLFEREEELNQLAEGDPLCLKLKWLSDPEHLEKGAMSARELLKLKERIKEFERERIESREAFKRSAVLKVQELTEGLGLPFDRIEVAFPSGSDLRKEAIAAVAPFAREALFLFSENEQLAQLANDNPLCRKLKWLSDPEHLGQGEMTARELLETMKALGALKVEKNRSREAFKQVLEGKLRPLTERLGIPFDGIAVEEENLQKKTAATVADFAGKCLHLFEREEELNKLAEGDPLCLKLKWLSDPDHLEKGEIAPRRLMEILLLIEGFKAEKIDSRQSFKRELASKLRQLTGRLGISYEGIPAIFPSGDALQKEAAARVADFARKASTLFSREEQLEQLTDHHSIFWKLKWLSDRQNLEKGEKNAREVLEILDRLGRYHREALRERESFKGRLGGHVSELAKLLGVL